MNGMIFTYLTVFLFLYHILIQRTTRKGKIREGYCALWIGDLLFVLFGTLITNSIYRFSLLPFFTLRNFLIVITLLLITVLMFILAPAGLHIFQVKEASPPEELIRSEYRFNDTMGILRNLIFIMLFLLPIAFALQERFPYYFPFLDYFENGELCGSFCLIAFLLLLPVCLRQSFFWLRTVTQTPNAAEVALLKTAQSKHYYNTRNFRM